MQEPLRRPMKRMALRLLLGAAGVVLTLAWFSLRGSHPRAGLEALPAQLWGGGGRVLTLELDISGPGTLHLDAWKPDSTGSDPASLEATQTLKAGHHLFRTELGPTQGGVLEVGLTKPSVGAEIKWVARLDGQEISSASERLDQPLKPGEGFFQQLDLEYHLSLPPNRGGQP